MAVKVAINGFGRIGRLAFRQMFGHEGAAQGYLYSFWRDNWRDRGRYGQ